MRLGIPKPRLGLCAVPTRLPVPYFLETRPGGLTAGGYTPLHFDPLMM